MRAKRDAFAPFDPLRSDRPLIVYVDFKSPYAFIAVQPTFELAESLGVAIDWRPLTLDIPSFAGSARLDKADRVAESQRSEGQWTFVKYAYHDARRYARLRGWTVRGTVKIWDTTLRRHGTALGEAAERLTRSQIPRDDVRALLEARARRRGLRGRRVAPARDRRGSVRGFREATEGEPRAEYLARQEADLRRGHLRRAGLRRWTGSTTGAASTCRRIRWILEGRRGPRARRRLPGGRERGAVSEPVRVAIDFKHPAAYLAVAPARALEARLGRTFDWLPLAVPPLPGARRIRRPRTAARVTAASATSIS